MRFGISGDSEHEERSNARVVSYELFNPQGDPIPGGVCDLRLGTTDHKFQCATCGHRKKQCLGHRGSLNLKIGVLQPVGISEVRRWLKVACIKCGALVVDASKYASERADRRLISAATSDNSGRPCPSCSAIHPKIVKDDEDNFTFWIEPVSTAESGLARTPGGKHGIKLYPDTIRAIFDRISDESVLALGRSLDAHPRKLVVRVVSIPPTTIRPGVKSFGGTGNSYHDSTNLIQHLVKRNGKLPDQLPDAMGPLGPAGPVPGELDRSVQNLQQIYYDLIMGSSATSSTQNNSGRRGLVMGARPVHSFMRNFPQKTGRLRANGLGKRVVFISRGTISGNMGYKIDEIGLPLEFARKLQVMEVVQEYNREWLMPFFLNGRRQYPGCSYITRRATGEVHDVSGLGNILLEIGDIVLRDVIDGDYAYINRQPTLERSSIGVHRVVVIQDPSIHTIQMNVLACEGYNADFDGDQMNLWVARAPASRAEAILESGIANWFISTKTSGPVNGQVQDSIVGCYELTKSSTSIDKYHTMALFSRTGVEPPRFDLKPANHRYSGRDIISLLLERTPINYRGEPSSYSDVYAPYIPYDKDEVMTVVEQGILKTGVLDKKSVGANANGGIFYLISREYGPKRALDMIFAMQQIALQFLMYSGFTVGASDLLPSEEALEQIRALVSSVVLEATVNTQRLIAGEIVPPIDSNVHEFYEGMQINALKLPEPEMLRWILGTIKPEYNGFYRMIAVKSKGSNPNLIHVAGAIGQTTINGARIKEQFGFRRTMPYYPRFATDPTAYGFVSNSYITGMRTAEYICQDMNGRFDLISKALSTATTGYFMRKGIMNNQSSITDNHRRVVKCNAVVQMLYGEDGLDARELEKVTFRTTMMSDANLVSEMGFDMKSAGSPKHAASTQILIDEAVAKIRQDRDTYRHTNMRIAAANFGQTFTTDVLLPVNVRRIVGGVFIASKNKPKVVVNGKDLSDRIRRVWDLCEVLPYTLINEIQAQLRTPVPSHKAAAASLLCMIVRAELCPAVLARIDNEQLGFIIESIMYRYSASMVDYGTAVGTLAAQAASQPLTQYMLDSHHRSVSGGTDKSGLVRVSEIYGAKPPSKEQSSEMLLPLKSGTLADAQEIATSIEYVTIKQFTMRYDILLEPYEKLVYPDFTSDATWIEEFKASHPLVTPPSDMTNWCVRIILDKSALVLKAVDLELIVRRIRARHPALYVIHTPESVPEIIIRVWPRSSLFKKGDDFETIHAISETILETPVRGIKGIIHASAKQIMRMRVQQDGSLSSEAAIAIKTVGTNMYHAALCNPVDTTEMITNSIGETVMMFGIEAGRAKIISETGAYMGDNTPNIRHLQVYADEMTRTGTVTSIELGGLKDREADNTLLRMSAGAPIPVAINAAFASTSSKVYGVAAPKLLGTIPKIGTLYNSTIVDCDFVARNTKTVDSVLDSLGDL